MGSERLGGSTGPGPRPGPGPREGQGAGQGAWFSRPENLKKSHFCNFLSGKGKGGFRQAGRRQGAGHRAQGQGTKGRVGLQDSILRFSRPQNLKNKIFASLGQGQRAKQGCTIPF